MKNETLARVLPLFALLLILLLGAAVWAQTSSGYHLKWHTISSGGGPIASASYTVNGTIGQAAASPPHLSSAGYRVASGYWSGAGTLGYRLYLPVVDKG